MYRIAICDDEKSTCAEIESYILMYSKLRFIRNEIEVFYSGEAFCEYVKQGNFFDLLFLDIELPAINGIEVGKFVRTSLGDEKMDIIYISSKINYAMQLFQNRPMDFLVKPVKYSAVEMNMDIFVKKKGIKSIYFECLVDKVSRRVFLSEILYFKSDDKKIRIILTNGEEISFYGKLKDIRMSVPENSFLVIHKSYMETYEYVNEYTYEWVKMINGDILNISKAHRKEVRSQLMQYEQ